MGGVVKLCTYSRSFYPYVWGQKLRVIIGAYVVIVDGKIVKRSFCESAGWLVENPVESEASVEGVKWIIANMDDLRDINVQVIFCGAGKEDLTKKIDEEGFQRPELLKFFNKVTFHKANKILINDGEDDDPDNTEIFDMYSAANKYFSLLYGDDINYGHEVIKDIKEEGIVKKVIVGMPEIRLAYGKPRSSWT